MADLGTLPGATFTMAYAINRDGLVVGTASGAGFQRVVTWRGGVFTDLGFSGDAYAVNGAGDVGGEMVTASGARQAFLHRGGVLSDLNTLIPAASGWELRWAHGINDTGQIVGVGHIDGQTHAYLLTPVSDSSPTSTPTGTPTVTPTAEPSATPSLAPAATATATTPPTDTPSPTATAMATASPTPTATATASSTPTSTPSPTPTSRPRGRSGR